MTASQETIDELRARAQATVGHISVGLESRMVPMVSQIVRIIRDISGKADQMSVTDLADYIKGEPSTMERIVAIAGSIGYNSSGAEVKSVHHAISLIGFEQVRMLAVSILLFENAQSKYAAETNRQLAGAALISGLAAGEMGRRVMPMGSELAFICGALRGYGRMLAATFMPDEYSAAVLRGARDGQDEAFKAAFGLPPLELGRQLLEIMQLPTVLLDSFVPFSPPARRKAMEDPRTTLAATADFGLRVAELLENPGLNTFNYESRMETLSREYPSAFYLSKPASRELLHQVVGVLESYRFRAGSYVGSVAIFRRLENLASDRRLSPLSAPVIPAPPPPPIVNLVKPPPKPVVVGNFEI